MMQPKVGDLVKHRKVASPDNMYIVIGVGFVWKPGESKKLRELELLQCTTNKTKFSLAANYKVISAS